MAHEPRVKYIGSFADSNYGIDGEGELFFTVADAVNALWARRRNGYSTHCPSLSVRGEISEQLYPAVTSDAYISLWRLDEGDRLTVKELVETHEKGNPIQFRDYFEPAPDIVVWVGARQAVRHGTKDEFFDQRRRRARQDVREAGSVVVTDA